MRYFCGKNCRWKYEIYCKNLMWIYLACLILFFYCDVKRQIPDHIYVSKGKDVRDEFEASLVVDMTNSMQETLAELRPVKKGKMSVANMDTSSNGTEDYHVSCLLFGVIPMKQVDVSVVKTQQVYVSGRLVGIYEKADGVLVLDTETICDKSGNEVAPSKNKIRSGDYIVSINGETVNKKSQLLEQIAKLDGEKVEIELIRKNKLVHTRITPVLTEDDLYMLGIWIKDDMAGIGTMTYYTKEGVFGALGHGIGDGTTGELLSVSDGAIYDMELTGITKGRKGEPGELSGTVYYGKTNHLGTLQANDALGIYGVLDKEEIANYASEDQMFPICYKQNILTKDGDSYILSDVSGEMKKYQVEIESVDMNASDSNKGIILKVKDPELIRLTGGIVQGMSGSPIIQNGKLIGAVTHVLVNDPTRGYGIFIEEMLEEN